MERKCFEEFYRKYVKRVYKFVYFRVGNDRRLAEDLTQDVFLKAFEAFDRYDPAISQSSWIYTIARNHLVNHYAKSRPGVSLEEIDGTLWMSQDGREHLAQKDVERRMLESIGMLPSQDAELIRMKYLEGWSFDDLADFFQKTSGALRVRAGRAMKRLKKDMENKKIL